jgi:hypothetical protein
MESPGTLARLKESRTNEPMSGRCGVIVSFAVSRTALLRVADADCASDVAAATQTARMPRWALRNDEIRVMV